MAKERGEKLDEMGTARWIEHSKILIEHFLKCWEQTMSTNPEKADSSCMMLSRDINVTTLKHQKLLFFNPGGLKSKISRSEHPMQAWVRAGGDFCLHDPWLLVAPIGP